MNEPVNRLPSDPPCPSWAVVMTVDEPDALVLANIAWHLAQGAAEIHVYLDRGDDPLFEHLSGVDHVSVTRCDEAWWQAHGPRGRRPDSQMRRQSINANHAYKAAQTGWLLHLDADEFLYQHRPVGEELRRLGPLDCELSVPVVERFYRQGQPIETLFQGGFRGSTRWQTDFDAEIFGENYPFLSNGLLGHSQGKSMVPTGQDYEVGIHWSFRGRRGPENRARQYHASSVSLLHFDGLTPLHFAVKLMRYGLHDDALLTKIVSEHRRNQVAHVMQNCQGLAEVLAFHDRLRVLAEAEEARLRDLGLVADLVFDPCAALQARFGAQDLSVAGFDAQLAARYPHVAAILEGEA